MCIRDRCIEKSAVGHDAAAWALGDRYYVSPKKLDYLKTRRWDFEREIAGSDIRISAMALHAETHLDGLHIYYNPYAQCPLRPDAVSYTHLRCV